MGVIICECLIAISFYVPLGSFVEFRRVWGLRFDSIGCFVTVICLVYFDILSFFYLVLPNLTWF